MKKTLDLSIEDTNHGCNLFWNCKIYEDNVSLYKKYKRVEDEYILV